MLVSNQVSILPTKKKEKFSEVCGTEDTWNNFEDILERPEATHLKLCILKGHNELSFENNF
jgi:hypothetical protein